MPYYLLFAIEANDTVTFLSTIRLSISTDSFCLFNERQTFPALDTSKFTSTLQKVYYEKANIS